MWYYFKKFIFSLAYLVFMGLLPYGIETIESNLAKIILNGLNILLFMVLMGFFMAKEGEDARKQLKVNDIERRRILQTGELRPIKRAPEFRPWKGFFIGLIACAPLLLTMLIHALIYVFGGTYEMVGVLGVTIYMGFFMPYVMIKYGAMLNENLVFTEYFASLYAVPIIVLLYGIAYILGAKKVERQYAFIEERTESARRG
jgi:predicted permease